MALVLTIPQNASAPPELPQFAAADEARILRFASPHV
jgi:hypothetical protein